MSKQKERTPASVVGGKVPWSPAPIGKHLALIKVELKSSEIPESGSDETTFTGRILVTQDIEGDLNYTWSIPDDVTIVEGSLSESLPNVKKGQIVEVTLTVSGFNKEKQRLVTLQASGKRGQDLLGNSAILASRPEDTWEAVAPEMKRAAEEQLGDKSRR
ncbi:hypothetical protein [Bdellovibrio bacteriovorus]|uniref:hypothetical protein n=1 Tax=Bdellovibrio bacteriovorus TaxID=959 RepID=UPI0035A727AC